MPSKKEFDPVYTEVFARERRRQGYYCHLNAKWHDVVVDSLASLESASGAPKGGNTNAFDAATEDHDTPSAETQDPTPEPIEPPDALDDIRKRDDFGGLPLKERETIQKARIGQGEFRRKVVIYWGDACAVSGCNQIDLLVASHIKPWRVCTNREALDETNGLLLVPNLDRAFDTGLVSFDDEGRILRSPQLSKKAADILGISDDMKLRHICPHHQVYLRHHREHVFRKLP